MNVYEAGERMTAPVTGSQLAEKTALITGGAGSIGFATANLFAREGARVMLVDLDEGDLRAAVAKLPAGRAGYVVGDVTKADQTQRYVDETVARFGKIDVLFSNAGNLGAIAPIEDYPLDVFQSVLDVHVIGAFLAAKYAVPQMNDGGSIIITSSIVGVRGSPGAFGYSVAKHAQVGLMRSLAKQLARRRIRVNTIHPGPVDNDFQLEVERRMSIVLQKDATAMLNASIPLGRHAQAGEIAAAVLFLASDASSFTTGSTFMADGGMSA
jgi:NAD(P)-dependent dehydrogenase (short-subunit alcohol dehydrogenase family)